MSRPFTGACSWFMRAYGGKWIAVEWSVARPQSLNHAVSHLRTHSQIDLSSDFSCLFYFGHFCSALSSNWHGCVFKLWKKTSPKIGCSQLAIWGEREECFVVHNWILLVSRVVIIWPRAHCQSFSWANLLFKHISPKEVLQIVLQYWQQNG